MAYTIYCHRNKTNGFEYIGMTGRSVKERWRGGIVRYANCKYFEQAIKEYGWDGFDHIVLFTGMTKEDAVKKETELIRANIERGISYNIRIDDDWLGNLRKRPVDVYDFDGNLIETCESIHDVCVKYESGETHTYYCVLGVKKSLRRKYVLVFHGESPDERIAKAKIDGRNGPAHNRKRVKMLSLDGLELRSFDSATEAAQYINASVSSISSCCSGNSKSCHGYKWSYV